VVFHPFFLVKIGIMQKLKVVLNYVKHQAKAYNRHGIHSPFVYDFLEQVLYTDKITPELKALKQLKTQLQNDTREIQITDLGAGSTINTNTTRLVKDVAKNSSKHPKYGRLFYRMIQYFQPESVIELGTSLGLSTVYFSVANPSIPIHTLEGCTETQKLAIQNFEKLGLKNIHPILGDFKNTLPELLTKTQKVDLVFFDGNHQEQPTLDYFEECLQYVNDQSIFIFDDIHWSEGMTAAWNKIKGHPKTVVTLDLFFLGIVFFDSRLTKQDFLIRF